METHTTLYVIGSDPDPLVEYGGTNYDIPIIRFGTIVGTHADIFLGGTVGMADWCRRFAARLNEFADEVEEKEQ